MPREFNKNKRISYFIHKTSIFIKSGGPHSGLFNILFFCHFKKFTSEKCNNASILLFWAFLVMSQLFPADFPLANSPVSFCLQKCSWIWSYLNLYHKSVPSSVQVSGPFTHFSHRDIHMDTLSLLKCHQMTLLFIICADTHLNCLGEFVFMLIIKNAGEPEWNGAVGDGPRGGRRKVPGRWRSRMGLHEAVCIPELCTSNL